MYTFTNNASRDADKFVIRLPDGMREVVSKMAKQMNRSMNSEIIHRLIVSLENEKQVPNGVSTTETWTPIPGMPVVDRNDHTLVHIIDRVFISSGVLHLSLDNGTVVKPARDYTPHRESV